MKDYLTFRKMILPILIQIIFWLGVIGCVVFGVITMIGGLIAMAEGSSGALMAGFLTVLSGLATILLGPLVVRIYAELLIIFFRINDTLTDIKNLLREKRSA